MTDHSTSPSDAADSPANAPSTAIVRAHWSWSSAVLATILSLEIIGLAIYAVAVFRRETQPQKVALRAEAALVENYPTLREELLQQTSAQAPVLAEHMSNELLEATLSARVELETLTIEQLEKGVDNAVELSADEFRAWLRANHDTIEDAFIQIEQAPNDARLLMLDTEASLEEQLGLDLRDQAKLALEVYRMFNDKLARLSAPNAELTQQERLERRMIRLLRAMAQ